MVFHWCLYNKQNITCLLMDMNFIFSWSTRYLTRSLRSLMRYRVDHSKIKLISTRGHVISSIYLNISIIQLMKVLHPRLDFHPLYLICSLQSSLLLGPLSYSPQLSLLLGPLSRSPQPSLFLAPLSWILGLLSWVFDLQSSVLLVS